MVTFAIIISVGLIVLGIVLGLIARNSGVKITDEDIQRYVFNNAFMNQIHDNFD
jgi:hypothetical protein